MDQRAEFVLKIKSGGWSFAQACLQFGISRKTGYKWWRRYQAGGLKALTERSRRPWNSPGQTSLQWHARIFRLRRRWTRWGPKKLRALLQGSAQGPVPAASTIGRILAVAGLVRPARRRRPAGPVVIAGALAPARASNSVWAVDFKGWFRLGNGERCEPLTVSDLYSRFVLCCQAGPDVSYEKARPVFERLFREYGLPERIRVDNGPPFGSRGAAGLSRLAVWWISLGIKPEFIDPGCPEQNGSHERMHRTLKEEAVQSVACDRRTQQRRINRWRREFNCQRPHESLGQKTPASLYEHSAHCYTGAQEPEYPQEWIRRRVRSNGEIRWCSGKRFIGEAFVGHTVGITQSKPGIHRVYFGPYLLGELEEGYNKSMRPSVMFRLRAPRNSGESKNRPERVESVTRGDRRRRELKLDGSSPTLDSLWPKTKNPTKKVLPMS